MKEAYLLRNRDNDPKQTLGTFVTTNGTEQWMCKTLELPYLDNKPNVSCIPFGRHLCTMTYSPKHNNTQYEVMVKGRTGIRFDVANFANQLLGCICLGDAHKDINADGELDIIHSGDTVKKFNEVMGGEDFYLNVVDIEECSILAS